MKISSVTDWYCKCRYYTLLDYCKNYYILLSYLLCCGLIGVFVDFILPHGCTFIYIYHSRRQMETHFTVTIYLQNGGQGTFQAVRSTPPYWPFFQAPVGCSIFQKSSDFMEHYQYEFSFLTQNFKKKFGWRFALATPRNGCRMTKSRFCLGCHFKTFRARWLKFQI